MQLEEVVVPLGDGVLLKRSWKDTWLCLRVVAWPHFGSKLSLLPESPCRIIRNTLQLFLLWVIPNTILPPWPNGGLRFLKPCAIISFFPLSFFLEVFSHYCEKIICWTTNRIFLYIFIKSLLTCMILQHYIFYYCLPQFIIMRFTNIWPYMALSNFNNKHCSLSFWIHCNITKIYIGDY